MSPLLLLVLPGWSAARDGIGDARRTRNLPNLLIEQNEAYFWRA